MNTQRLALLNQYLEETPDDPFTIYAIANEYLGFDDQKALEYFELLIESHPDYTATYYHLANLYRDLGQTEKARLTYETGMEKALKSHDALAHRELKNAYDEFMMD
ncbi:MAG: tetratricopeptide repeat protein [Cyclobacteriaceae bacterium]|nr:tetratricopeptide repeat protein [Cyclobacteriaceae bacterium]